MTQRDMERASRGRLTQAAISMILSGDNVATLIMLDTLAKLLKVPAHCLLAARKDWGVKLLTVPRWVNEALGRFEP